MILQFHYIKTTLHKLLQNLQKSALGNVKTVQWFCATEICAYFANTNTMVQHTLCIPNSLLCITCLLVTSNQIEQNQTFAWHQYCTTKMSSQKHLLWVLVCIYNKFLGSVFQLPDLCCTDHNAQSCPQVRSKRQWQQMACRHHRNKLGICHMSSAYFENYATRYSQPV